MTFLSLSLFLCSVPVEFASFRHFLRSLNQNFVYLLEEDFLPTERAFLLQELWSQLDASLGTEESQRVFLSPVRFSHDNSRTNTTHVLYYGCHVELQK